MSELHLELDFTETNIFIDIIRFKLENESYYHNLIDDLDSEVLYDSSQVYAILKRYKAYDIVEVAVEKLNNNDVVVKRKLYDEREEN